MKKAGLFVATAVIVLAAIGILAGVPAHASSTKQVVQGSSNHSLYKAGNSVLITGTVNGDIFCAGETVTVDATVNGDVLCAGQNVTVGGRVNGSARLIGENVNLSGTVTRGVAMAGQNIVIERSARVGQDASLAGKTVTVDGVVNRDLTGAGDAIALGGFIGRNVSLQVNNLALGSGANLVGNLTYTSPHMLQRTGGAQVHGTVTYHKGVMHNRGGIGISTLIWFELYWLVTLLVLAVVLVALFPHLFRHWNPVLWSGFWWSVLVGFIAMFVVPAIVALLLATVIGVPLGILLLVLWIASALVAWPLAAYFIGSRVVSSKVHPVLIVLVGGVILLVLELIPILGWIVAIVAYWLGSGMLLRGIRHGYRRPAYVENEDRSQKEDIDA